MLKIIGGEFRSRILLSPDDADVSRPYTSRVKESVFNLLRGWFDGARVLDLFAGVGTMGIEAISRGAAHATMVERERSIYELLRRNVESLGCGDRAELVLADALSSTLITKIQGPFDIAFIDPPYRSMMAEATRGKILAQIENLHPMLAEKAFVVLRSPISARAGEFTIAGFDGPEPHDYGRDMHVLLYAPAATTSLSEEEKDAASS